MLWNQVLILNRHEHETQQLLGVQLFTDHSFNKGF